MITLVTGQHHKKSAQTTWHMVLSNSHLKSSAKNGSSNWVLIQGPIFMTPSWHHHQVKYIIFNISVKYHILTWWWHHDWWGYRNIVWNNYYDSTHNFYHQVNDIIWSKWNGSWNFPLYPNTKILNIIKIYNLMANKENNNLWIKPGFIWPTACII